MLSGFGDGGGSTLYLQPTSGTHLIVCMSSFNRNSQLIGGLSVKLKTNAPLKAPLLSLSTIYNKCIHVMNIIK